MGPAPEGIPAFIHPELFPYGNIADGTEAEVEAAERWLAAQGCTRARGPLGPTTWHRYRAVTESSGRPPFLSEPTSGPDVWLSRGYTPCAHYASALADNLAQAESAAERSCRLVTEGWSIESLAESGHFEQALDTFYRLSIVSFSKAFAYTPLSGPEFQAMYAPILPLLDPRMVLTAKTPGGDAAGFCFAIPDRLNPDLNTFIIKTLAVEPRYRQTGIGSWLVGVAHSIAHELGYIGGGIHALMWTDSRSRNISSHAGQIFRRYALFEKVL